VRSVFGGVRVRQVNSYFAFEAMRKVGRIRGEVSFGFRFPDRNQWLNAKCVASDESHFQAMRPRHAAALTLMGWYLTVRHTRGIYRDLWEPVSQWKIVQCFDPATACGACAANCRCRRLRATRRTRIECSKGLQCAGC
jgi:hypothetical protein